MKEAMAAGGGKQPVAFTQPHTMPKPLSAIQALVRKAAARIRQRSVSRQDVLIGQVLVEGGLITADQLEKSLETQRKILMEEGRVVRLGMVICQLGYTSEEKIVKAVNERYKISIQSLSDDIHHQVVERHGTFFDRLPYPRVPIWFQLAVASTFIVVLTIVAMSLVVLNQQKGRLYQQTVRMGTVSLNYFVNNARIPLLEDNVLALNTLIRDATRVEGLRWALIVDTRGIIKAHTDVEQIGKGFAPPPARGPRTRSGDVTYYPFVAASGEHMLNLSREVRFKQAVLGKVHVAVSLDFIRQLVARERVSVIAITVAVAIVGLLISVLFGFRFSRPVDLLVQATEQIAKGNYRYKVALKRKDELGNLAAAFNRMSEELWKNAMAQRSFGKYLGSEITSMILADPQKTWLKGSRNPATILLADVRDFTALAADQRPEQVVAWLNEFLEIATAVIDRHGGYVDKFIGDAVMAVFGVPVYRRDHARRAVECAVALQRRLRRQPPTNPLMERIGISIHCGEVVAGNIGSSTRIEYTVIGDTVNTAARLNALAGPGKVVISQAVKEVLDDAAACRDLGCRQLKGLADPIGVYEVQTDR